MKTKTVKLIGFNILNFGNIEVIEGKVEGGKIVFKGPSGSGKTSATDAIKKGHNSTNLKTSRQYGKGYSITQWLEDGIYTVKVVLKNDQKGKDYYTLEAYETANPDVKVTEIEGQKLTAKDYLGMFADPLIKGVDEFCTSDSTRQKDFCHTLFKSQLAKLNIDEILTQLKEAEDKRDLAELSRKQVGEGVLGTDDWLRKNSIQWDNVDTHPIHTDIDVLKRNLTELEVQRTNEKNKTKTQKTEILKGIEGNIREVTLQMQNYNQKAKEANNNKTRIKGAISSLHSTLSELVAFGALQMANASDLSHKIDTLTTGAINAEDKCIIPLHTVTIEDKEVLKCMLDWKDGEYFERVETSTPEGKVTEKKPFDISNCGAHDLLSNIQDLRLSWLEVNKGELTELPTPEFDAQIDDLNEQILKVDYTNLLYKALQAFLHWQGCHNNVLDLKLQISRKYEQINTGVEGLVFGYNSGSARPTVDLCYNGKADPNFYGTIIPSDEPIEYGRQLKHRKVCEFSESQRALICLELQCARIAAKPKAINLAYFDAPMCSKTYALTQEIAKRYGIDITLVATRIGDYTQSELQIGEILIEGGKGLLPIENE